MSTGQGRGGNEATVDRHALSVSQLTQYLKRLLEADEVLGSVVVRGEISNFRQPSSGHMYFTLKDEGAALKCVMFRGQNYRLRFVPHDGQAVDLYGYISLYERDGQYQLYVQEMRQTGLGDLHLAFEQLKVRLAAEGLFADDIKRSLPLLPRRVAIVTSPTGAALRDVLNVAARRNQGVPIVVVPTQVQGDLAAAGIAAALGVAGRLPGVDVIILTRGGGSIEELWSFNEEVVARAIRSCPKPVVVGVGHEVDITIADLAADRRAATPSSAAEIVFPERAALLEQVESGARRLRIALRARSQELRRQLDRLAASAVLRRPHNLLATRAQSVDYLVHRLGRVASGNAERRRLLMREAAGRLDAMSPLAVLARGYAVCLDERSRRVLVRADDVAAGEKVAVALGSGGLRCTVDQIVADRSELIEEAKRLGIEQ